MNKIIRLRLIHLPIATSTRACGERRNFFNKKYYRNYNAGKKASGDFLFKTTANEM